MRIDYYVLGYRKISIDACQIHKAATALLHSGLTAGISSNGTFFVPEYRFCKYKRALSGIEYEAGETKGIFGFLKKNRGRYGIIAAVVLSVLLFAFSENMIWDIRIDGNEFLSDSFVMDALEKAGVYVGAEWSDISVAEKETEILEATPELAWININRRGTVAYVTVMEKSGVGGIEQGVGFSNIVSTCDCIIEDITVSSGVAAVKVGDTVREGDLLISGVIPAELGGGFVEASGTVIGRCKESVSVFVTREERKVEYERVRIGEIKLKIFSFFLNIYKKYGNSHNGCVIIEEESGFVLFSRYKLPLKLCKSYIECTREVLVKYTDDQLVGIASQRLTQKKMLALSEADLLTASTFGEFRDGGYFICCEMTVLKPITSTETLTA